MASSPTPGSTARWRRSPPVTRKRASASCCPGTSAQHQADCTARPPLARWAVRTAYAWSNAASGRSASPVVKQLESFDFKAIPSLNKMLVLDLARGDCIDRRENAILFRPERRGQDSHRPGPRPRRLPEGPQRALHHRLPAGPRDGRGARREEAAPPPGPARQGQPADRRRARLRPPCHRPEANCCSTSSAGATRTASPSSPRTCPSRNGPRSSPASDSPARCSTASPTMSISWR